MNYSTSIIPGVSECTHSERPTGTRAKRVLNGLCAAMEKLPLALIFSALQQQGTKWPRDLAQQFPEYPGLQALYSNATFTQR